MGAGGTALLDLARIGEIRGAMVVRRDGTVLDQAGIDSGDQEILSNAATISLRLSETVGRYKQFEGFSQLFVEFDRGLMVVQKLDSDVILLVLTDERTTIGMIRHHLTRARPALVEAYAQEQEQQQ
jgi:predicted regulator of Ras-like GTPase activity (Roadblock/LC7/MglB family)